MWAGWRSPSGEGPGLDLRPPSGAAAPTPMTATCATSRLRRARSRTARVAGRVSQLGSACPWAGRLCDRVCPGAGVARDDCGGPRLRRRAPTLDRPTSPADEGRPESRAQRPANPCRRSSLGHPDSTRSPTFRSTLAPARADSRPLRADRPPAAEVVVRETAQTASAGSSSRPRATSSGGQRYGSRPRAGFDSASLAQDLDPAALAGFAGEAGRATEDVDSRSERLETAPRRPTGCAPSSPRCVAGGAGNRLGRPGRRPSPAGQDRANGPGQPLTALAAELPVRPVAL